MAAKKQTREEQESLDAQLFAMMTDAGAVEEEDAPAEAAPPVQSAKPAKASGGWGAKK